MIDMWLSANVSAVLANGEKSLVSGTLQKSVVHMESFIVSTLEMEKMKKRPRIEGAWDQILECILINPVARQPQPEWV